MEREPYAEKGHLAGGSAPSDVASPDDAWGGAHWVEFLSLASHELRTPLMPLRMYAEVLEKLVQAPDRGSQWEGQVREVLGKFNRQISHMARLVDDLVDVARLETGKLSVMRRPVDLKAVLATAAEQASSNDPRPPVRITVPDLPRRVLVHGDQERLVQLVLNLLTNAARHASSSPNVDLSLEVLRDQGREWARILVRDYGPGIPAETRQSLFTRFGQRGRDLGARSGLGLGLYICRGIVEQHDGRIRVDSTPGEGTTFTVELPRSE